MAIISHFEAITATSEIFYERTLYMFNMFYERTLRWTHIFYERTSSVAPQSLESRAANPPRKQLLSPESSHRPYHIDRISGVGPSAPFSCRLSSVRVPCSHEATISGQDFVRLVRLFEIAELRCVHELRKNESPRNRNLTVPPPEMQRARRASAGAHLVRRRARKGAKRQVGLYELRPQKALSELS